MQRIGIITDNSMQVVELLLLSWKNKISVVLIDWKIPFDSALLLLKRANVNTIYIPSSYPTPCQSEYDGIKLFRFVRSSKPETVPLHLYTLWNEIDHTSKAECLLLFSSGTTNPAKGICLSYYAIYQNVLSIISYMKPTDSDHILIIKTLSHSSTITGELLVGLETNCTISICPTVQTISQLFHAINNFSISILCINPSLMTLLLKQNHYQSPTVRLVYTSGAIASFKAIQSLHSCFPNADIFNVYGLTEAGPRVSAQTSFTKNLPFSVGKTISGVDVKIINSDDSLCSTSQIGEICVSSVSLAIGYLDGPLHYLSTDPVYIHTGDFGYIDNDNELYILGRIDDIIHVGAHNVNPTEIETKIQSLSFIDDCLVFGIPHTVLGNAPICLYKSTKKTPKIEREILNFCLANLAPYEIPITFIPTTSFPTTANGKKSRALAYKEFCESKGGLIRV